MESNSIVVVSLHTPKERVWGMLMDLNAAGVTLRGIDISSFDDFVRQALAPEERYSLPTVFFPMTRVERISLDEPVGSIPSLANVFEHKVGHSLKEYLEQFA